MSSSDTQIGDNDPIVGTVLGGRYEVLGELGSGGMAMVYVALDRTLNRKVVIKIPRSEFLQVPGFRQRFSREIGSQVQLGHRNILGIQDIGEHEGVSFAVLDYLSGGDLYQRIDASGGVQTLEDVIKWLPSIAAGLDFIAESKMVHRDVKPQNILFDHHGHAFLSDFGIATAMRAVESAAPSPELTQLTTFGGFVGSAQYAPPEALERELSPAYDQYSLGVTVYWALTRQLPIPPRTTPEATMAARAHENPIPISNLQSTLPAAAARAIMRSLERNPADRFESCKAFADAMTAAIRPARPERDRRWVPAVVVSVAAAAGLLLWMLNSPGPDVVADGVTPPKPSSEASVQANSPSSVQAEPQPNAQVPPPTAQVDQAPPDPLTSPAATEPLAREPLPDLAMEMVAVAGGSFLSGCNASVDNECREDESAAKRRDVNAFSIDRTEVTVAQYESCVNEGGCTVPDDGGDCNWSVRGRRDHPINCVDWSQATSYCESVSKRLPTEWEWEKAARGTDGRKYAWGNEYLMEPPTRANIADDALGRTGVDFLMSSGYDDGYVSTAPVGSFVDGMSPVRALDMIGNVWEWTQSRYAPGDDERVIRGGSWRDAAADARASARLPSYPSRRPDTVGFRCVK